MSGRLRRLTADYEKIRNELMGHKHIIIDKTEGNPPEKYYITYKVKGLKWDENRNRPVEINTHKIVIYLHKEYPRQKPKCNMKTEIFHPNFGPYICIGDYWAAGETLVDVVIKIGNMIQFIDYNCSSALNHMAAEWVNRNKHYLPVGKVDLYQPEPDIDMDEDNNTCDFEIELTEAKQDNLEDIDIEIE